MRKGSRHSLVRQRVAIRRSGRRSQHDGVGRQIDLAWATSPHRNLFIPQWGEGSGQLFLPQLKASRDSVYASGSICAGVVFSRQKALDYLQATDVYGGLELAYRT